jgi:hypothetical protein
MASSQLRRLNQPVPVDVRLGADGRPERVAWHRHRSGRGHGPPALQHVEVVLDTWCVDDGWWGDAPVRRLYHELQLVGGTRLVVSWDLLEGRWLAQR